ncbi:uncharacterized protein LOC135826371 isoform X1 [Sycon ciliatum]|uniref:uncharacterized protein LOC135826371 isoform X1 n=1 Tax=Sycon ciliatum TaxID=27933 RepID=UPI0031F6CEF1
MKSRFSRSSQKSRARPRSSTGSERQASAIQNLLATTLYDTDLEAFHRSMRLDSAKDDDLEESVEKETADGTDHHDHTQQESEPGNVTFPDTGADVDGGDSPDDQQCSPLRTCPPTPAAGSVSSGAIGRLLVFPGARHSRRGTGTSTHSRTSRDTGPLALASDGPYTHHGGWLCPNNCAPPLGTCTCSDKRGRAKSTSKVVRCPQPASKASAKERSDDTQEKEAADTGLWETARYGSNSQVRFRLRTDGAVAKDTPSLYAQQAADSLCSESDIDLPGGSRHRSADRGLSKASAYRFLSVDSAGREGEDEAEAEDESEVATSSGNGALRPPAHTIISGKSAAAPWLANTEQGVDPDPSTIQTHRPSQQGLLGPTLRPSRVRRALAWIATRLSSLFGCGSVRRFRWGLFRRTGGRRWSRSSASRGPLPTPLRPAATRCEPIGGRSSRSTSSRRRRRSGYRCTSSRRSAVRGSRRRGGMMASNFGLGSETDLDAPDYFRETRCRQGSGSGWRQTSNNSQRSVSTDTSSRQFDVDLVDAESVFSLCGTVIPEEPAGGCRLPLIETTGLAPLAEVCTEDDDVDTDTTTTSGDASTSASSSCYVDQASVAANERGRVPAGLVPLPLSDNSQCPVVMSRFRRAVKGATPLASRALLNSRLRSQAPSVKTAEDAASSQASGNGSSFDTMFGRTTGSRKGSLVSAASAVRAPTGNSDTHSVTQASPAPQHTLDETDAQHGGAYTLELIERTSGEGEDAMPSPLLVVVNNFPVAKGQFTECQRSWMNSLHALWVLSTGEEKLFLWLASFEEDVNRKMLEEVALVHPLAHHLRPYFKQRVSRTPNAAPQKEHAVRGGNLYRSFHVTRNASKVSTDGASAMATLPRRHNHSSLSETKTWQAPETADVQQLARQQRHQKSPVRRVSSGPAGPVQATTTTTKAAQRRSRFASVASAPTHPLDRLHAGSYHGDGDDVVVDGVVSIMSAASHSLSSALHYQLSSIRTRMRPTGNVVDSGGGGGAGHCERAASIKSNPSAEAALSDLASSHSVKSNRDEHPKNESGDGGGASTENLSKFQQEYLENTEPLDRFDNAVLEKWQALLEREKGWMNWIPEDDDDNSSTSMKGTGASTRTVPSEQQQEKQHSGQQHAVDGGPVPPSDAQHGRTAWQFTAITSEVL